MGVLHHVRKLGNARPDARAGGAMRMPDLDHRRPLSEVSRARVELALKRQLSISDLKRDEQEVYLDRIEELQALPTPEEQAFFEARRLRGVGVGMDETGSLVFQRAEGSLPEGSSDQAGS